MNGNQYNPKQSVRVKWAYSRVGAPMVDFNHPAPVKLEKLHQTFQAARASLKTSQWSTLFVAVRANGNDSYVLGRFCKDGIGRVRWYPGWPHMNGLLQLSERKPFQ